MAKKQSATKTVETLTHEEATRKNIPTAEYQSVLQKQEQSPVRVAYERRNRDLDPQLVWRGKDQQDWSDLVVHAPPLYIQEKVQPKALIDDLLRETRESEHEAGQTTPDLFADFNGIPKGVDKTEFYQHDQNWSNRMILGDSLQVMASLAEREGLRGKVQCIYFDPPYGIAFNSNFQWSTTSKTVTDGKIDHITREPEQVKAFRDTWRDGIHSYLTYLRDRLTVARDLLTESGSIFIQIGDENLHRVRAVTDEVFGDQCFVVTIPIKKKGNQKSNLIDPVNDYLLWYSRTHRTQGQTRFRPLFEKRQFEAETLRRFNRVALRDGREFPLESVPDPADPTRLIDYRFQPERLSTDWPGSRLFYPGEQLTSGGERPNQSDPVDWEGVVYRLNPGLCWKTTTRSNDGSTPGMRRLQAARRLVGGRGHLNYKRFLEDFGYTQLTNWWDGLGGAPNAVYVVQTNEEIVKRCILMTTDPGDLVLDPTCGAGTTAYVAEHWGRRWITVDTSRVALALARARIMGARYPFFLLADSREGQLKEAEVTHSPASSKSVQGKIRHGFVYERVPHITLGSIANNVEIDVIWAKWQVVMEPIREKLLNACKRSWQEWEIPRNAGHTMSDSAKALHAEWWQAWISRQQEIDKSIEAKAEFEYLYDKPYDDKRKIRVAGPFTVESLSPHRVLGVDEHDELIDTLQEQSADYLAKQTFPQMILENLKVAGVQQAHKEDKIFFTSITPWPGRLICADGRYLEGDRASSSEKRAAIFIGPEFGTVTRPDLVEAAREAGDADFDVLIACAFNYEGHATEFNKLGRIPVLKARMNADLHMAGDLKNTGKGNLFVIFGEPDIAILPGKDDKMRVKVNGVDVFHPSTGEVRSDGADGIACWFIDTDYNEESFFVRHAYFLGATDPYSALRTTLKAEINEEAWSTLHSDTSRPFPKPKSGRIAVKVINHLGDEVMKVFKVT
jgi:adenine-specific DNA-methyltransferase